MLFFGTVLALVAAAAAIPAPEIVTNAERLARRLPPLPPKFGRSLPGYARAVDNPTPAFGASGSKPSSMPVSYTGHIEVVRIIGRTKIGDLASTKDGFGVGSKPVHVSFTTTSSGKGPFDIHVTKRKSMKHGFLGGASKSATKLSASSAAAVELEDVKETPRLSPPKHMRGGFGESAIWSINPSSKKISAHWINPDGSKAPTEFVHDADKNMVFIVGSAKAYIKAHPGRVSAVELLFVNS